MLFGAQIQNINFLLFCSAKSKSAHTNINILNSCTKIQQIHCTVKNHPTFASLNLIFLWISFFRHSQFPTPRIYFSNFKGNENVIVFSFLWSHVTFSAYTYILVFWQVERAAPAKTYISKLFTWQWKWMFRHVKLAMLHSSFDAHTMGYVRLTHIVRYVTRGTKVLSINFALYRQRFLNRFIFYFSDEHKKPFSFAIKMDLATSL